MGEVIEVCFTKKKKRTSKKEGALIRPYFNDAQQVARYLEEKNPENFIFITKFDDDSIYTFIGTKTYYDASALAFNLPSAIEESALEGKWSNDEN